MSHVDQAAQAFRRQTLRRAAALLWVAAGALALASVFAAYLSPALIVDLASRVWNCF